MSAMGPTKWWVKEYLCSAGGHLTNVTRLTCFPFMTSHRKHSVTRQWASWTGQLAVCGLFTQSISTQLILTFRPCRCYFSALLTTVTDTSLCRPSLALLVDTAFRTLQSLIPTSPSFLTMCAVHLFLNVFLLSAWFLHCNTIARSVQQKGTTTWFMEGSIFGNWKSTASLLWIHGKRTFLYAFLI